MKNNSADKVRLVSLDELLGTSAASSAAHGNEKGKVVRLPLSSLHTFHSHPHGHPFRVLDDARMAETVESIRINGVLEPGIARPDKDFPGEYEVISGHRRRRASELAGLEDMPFIIQDLSDYQAIVIMADANLHREDILPSETAWAYREKYEALKAMGLATEGGRSDDVLAQEMGQSRNTIQRYIRLTYLAPQLLQYVDNGKLPRNTAADLSYLKKTEQEQLFDIMTRQMVIPSGLQAQKLKEFSREGNLTESVMQLVLERDTANKVSLPAKKLRGYFPESYTGQQIEEVIYSLLDEWKAREMNKV